jgi:glucokinase
MTPDRNIIGIDIGGTKISSAVVSGDRIINPMRKRTATSDCEAAVRQIEELVKLQQKEFHKPIAGVGIAIAGAVEHRSGIVIESPNLAFTANFPLKCILGNRIDIPVYVGSELKMSALGELYYGAAKGKQNVVVITIGTGVGLP